jgi:hypothetical protein
LVLQPALVGLGAVAQMLAAAPHSVRLTPPAKGTVAHTVSASGASGDGSGGSVAAYAASATAEASAEAARVGATQQGRVALCPDEASVRALVVALGASARASMCSPLDACADLGAAAGDMLAVLKQVGGGRARYNPPCMYKGWLCNGDNGNGEGGALLQ